MKMSEKVEFKRFYDSLSIRGEGERQEEDVTQVSSFING